MGDIAGLFKRRVDIGTVSDESLKDVDEPDFIPYACHYDAHTLLTKNGELLQTIKIVGFGVESVSGKQISLRAAVRQAVFDSIKSDEYALWFHTIRRKKSLDPGGDYPPDFARYLNQRWKDHHGWADKYINELYITVVREGQEAEIDSPKSFVRGIIPARDKKYREQYLEGSHLALTGVVDDMLKALSSYGARRIGMAERDGVFYSEPTEFFNKIVNLVDSPMPAPVEDLSEYLHTHEIAFGFNIMEVRGPTGRRFGTILTIKEYKELSTKAIDRFLQLPQQFIVSQCIDFINRDKAVASYTYQREMMNWGEADHLAKVSGLDDIIHSDRGSPIDYGEQQLTILLIEDSMEGVEKSTKSTVEALQSLGIVSFREDLQLEECYWAQMPGNFEFITRLRSINTARVGGFASLHNFPAGRAAGNHWGPAVTVFHTAAGTPYFFNFHVENNGHTAIIGPLGAGKTVLLNFLCSEARKFNGKLFFFDKDKGSKIFIHAIGGSYLKPLEDSQAKTLQLNPLSLPDSVENRAFLALWLESLMAAGGETIAPEERAVIPQLVAGLYGMPAGQRTLSTASAMLAQNHGRLGALLAPWCGSGKYAYLFENSSDTLTLDKLVYGFEMGSVLREQMPHIPLQLYLLHRIKASLDGRPAMIVLDEAWTMLDNPVFAPQLNGWLEEMKAQNALVIFATESVDEAGKSKISSTLMDHIATAIFLPNPNPGRAYQEIFRLTDTEFERLSLIRPETRSFLFKHGDESVVATLNLKGMKDILSVLSAQEGTVALMEAAIAEAGSDPERWLPVFHKKVA